MTEHKLVIEARRYLNTPFFYKGRSKGGTDCAGLVCMSLSNSILPGYEFLDYTFNPHYSVVKKELLSIADIVENPITGDILLFDLYGMPQHIAIYTAEDTIIHTYRRIGKVVEEKYTNYWKNKLDSIYRVR